MHRESRTHEDWSHGIPPSTVDSAIVGIEEAQMDVQHRERRRFLKQMTGLATAGVSLAAGLARSSRAGPRGDQE